MNKKDDNFEYSEEEIDFIHETLEQKNMPKEKKRMIDIIRDNVNISTTIVFLIAYGLIFYNYGLKAVFVTIAFNCFVNMETVNKIMKTREYYDKEIINYLESLNKQIDKVIYDNDEEEL